MLAQGVGVFLEIIPITPDTMLMVQRIGQLEQEIVERAGRIDALTWPVRSEQMSGSSR